jgi:hypothetical protein
MEVSLYCPAERCSILAPSKLATVLSVSTTTSHTPRQYILSLASASAFLNSKKQPRVLADLQLVAVCTLDMVHTRRRACTWDTVNTCARDNILLYFAQLENPTMVTEEMQVVMEAQYNTRTSERLLSSVRSRKYSIRPMLPCSWGRGSAWGGRISIVWLGAGCGKYKLEVCGGRAEMTAQNDWKTFLL